MRLLDLFSGAGGAAEGYHRAGFTDIVGIDIDPQPSYPFAFIQADALDPPVNLDDFDLIHASPPCQVHTPATNRFKDRHVDLIPETRRLLAGRRSVIENVPAAPLRCDVLLCGTMFNLRIDGYELRRHRIFELNGFPLVLTPPHQHQSKTLSVVGHMSESSRRTHAPHRLDKSSMRAGRVDARRLMDVGWMSDAGQGHEMAEAIPPAYTEFIGNHVLELVSDNMERL